MNLSSSAIIESTSNQAFSGLKVELSKYRLYKQEKVAQNQPSNPKTVPKTTPGGLKKTKLPTSEQKELGTKEIKSGATKLSFSTFLNPTESKAQTSNLHKTFDFEQDDRSKDVLSLDHRVKSVDRRETTKDGKINKGKKLSRCPEFYNPASLKNSEQADRKTSFQFSDGILGSDGGNLKTFQSIEFLTSNFSTLEDDRDSFGQLKEQKEQESDGGETKETQTSDDAQKEDKKFQQAYLNKVLQENAELKKKVVDLEQKNTKWKVFCNIMQASYKDLKKEWKEYIDQNKLDKKTIATLKEQTQMLKMDYSKAVKQNEAKAAKKQLQDTEKAKLKTIETKFKTVQTEHKKLQEDLAFLWNENQKLRQSQEDVNKYKEASEYYRTVAEEKFKECSSLAEEIICLRTDLDRLNLKYLKTQKELQGPKIEAGSPSKSKELRLSAIGKGSVRTSQKKVTIVAPMQKHEGNFDICDDVETPSPLAFEVMPCH